jgi:DNA-binding transcriptional MerR regulator
LSLAENTSEFEAELDKSPDAFRTISEVADDLDVPQHVLRFWETRFPQIRPLKRGGGRRYYRPDDVLLLQGIRRLLYGEGYTIKGVQRILKEQGVRRVQAIGRGEPLGQLAPELPVDTTPSEPQATLLSPPAGENTAARAQRGPAFGAALLDERILSALKATLFELAECKRVIESTRDDTNRDDSPA